MSEQTETPTQAIVSITMSHADVYRIFADQIIKEDNLINQRMTWGLLSNAAALTLVGGLYAACKDFSRLSNWLLLGFFVIFILSIYITRQAIETIQSARKQIYYIRDVYERNWAAKFEEIGLPRPFGSRITSFMPTTNIVPDYTIQFPDYTPDFIVWTFKLFYKKSGKKSDFAGKRPFWWWAERMLAAVIWTWIAIIVAGIGVIYSRWP